MKQRSGRLAETVGLSQTLERPETRRRIRNVERRVPTNLKEPDQPSNRHHLPINEEPAALSITLMLSP